MNLFKVFCVAFIISSVTAFLILRYGFGQVSSTENLATALCSGVMCGLALIVLAKRNAAPAK